MLLSFYRPTAGRSAEPACGQRQPKNILGSIEACIPALRRYSTALLRDRDKAEDAVRRCLLQALGNLQSMKADQDLKPRLFRILQKILDRAMRRQRFRSVIAMPAHRVDTLRPEPGRQQLDSQSDLLKHLGCLSEQQRSVVLLICVENLTYTETAAILRIPITAVILKLASGRERLLLAEANAG